MRPVLRAGGSDCEEIAADGLAQPVNALSSLAYVVAAAWLVGRARRLDASAQRFVWVYAAAVSLNGWGGGAYHGTAYRSGHWLHDWGIATTLAAMALWNLGVGRGRPIAWRWWVVVAVALAVVCVWPGPALVTAGVLVALVVTAEVVLVRRGLRPAPARSATRRAYAVTLGALVVGLVTKQLTSTGGPLCDSDGLLQGHALWHVLTAIAMAAWAVAALPALVAPRSAARTPPA